MRGASYSGYNWISHRYEVIWSRFSGTLIITEYIQVCTMTTAQTIVPDAAAAAVLQPSDPIPNDAVSVQGPDFERSLTLDQFLGSYERIGFQANSLGKAISIVNKMVCCDYVLCPSGI